MKIGIRLESLGLPVRRGVAAAARIGVGGVQVDAVGDLTPAQLSQTGRRELKHLLRSHNLELTALGCPLRHGLDVPANLDARIEHVCNVLTLSFDLGPRIVVLQPGKVAGDQAAPAAQTLREALSNGRSVDPATYAQRRCQEQVPGIICLIRGRACWRLAPAATFPAVSGEWRACSLPESLVAGRGAR